MMYLLKGRSVAIRAHKSARGKGLSYPSFVGVLLEDARVGGWDVVDVRSGSGKDVSIYSFSISPIRTRATRGHGRAVDSSHNRRDYPKIELFYGGKYVGTTTWARTVREAKERYIASHPGIDPSKVKASRGR
jgi:hypothetical protein